MHFVAASMFARRVNKCWMTSRWPSLDAMCSGVNCWQCYKTFLFVKVRVHMRRGICDFAERCDFNRRFKEYYGGKFHCTIYLLFDWFGLVCFANKSKNIQLSCSWFQTVKQEVNSTVILSPLVFPGIFSISSKHQAAGDCNLNEDFLFWNRSAKSQNPQRPCKYSFTDEVNKARVFICDNQFVPSLIFI